jgi:hypothetical protein
MAARTKTTTSTKKTATSHGAKTASTSKAKTTARPKPAAAKVESPTDLQDAIVEGVRARGPAITLD